MAIFVTHTKMFLYASFSFSYWKYSCTTFWPSFLLFSPTRSVLLLATQKSREKFHNARSLQENNAHSAANQSGRTIVAIYNKLMYSQIDKLSDCLKHQDQLVNSYVLSLEIIIIDHFYKAMIIIEMFKSWWLPLTSKFPYLRVPGTDIKSFANLQQNLNINITC